MPPTAPLNRPIRLAVLISGGGTTLTNLVQEIAAQRLVAEIPLVVASRGDCGGVAKARAAGLRCDVVARKAFGSTQDFSAAIFEKCRETQVDLVICGGFLSLLQIPPDFELRVMNIHPMLIPAFCGKGYYGHHVHEAVLARGCKFSGCTVHFVDNEYDHGPIISQSVVPVLDDDTPDALAARVFEQECAAYPEAIRFYAAGELIVEGNRVRRRR